MLEARSMEAAAPVQSPTIGFFIRDFLFPGCLVLEGPSGNVTGHVAGFLIYNHFSSGIGNGFPVCDCCYLSGEQPLMLKALNELKALGSNPDLTRRSHTPVTFPVITYSLVYGVFVFHPNGIKIMQPRAG
jgi:hypothetical protein